MKKTISKLFMATAVIAATSSVAVAQSGRFSLGPEIAIPMGDFGDAFGLGIGGSIRYEAPIGDNIGLTGTVGYITFSGKDIEILGTTIEGESTYMIPIQAGLKYYFTDQQEGFYGHAILGVHMHESSEVEIDLTTGAMSVEESTAAAFSFAPEIGYHLANLDFGLRYQTVSTEGSASSYLGLRIAYVFGE